MSDVHPMAPATVTAAAVLMIFIAACQTTSGITLTPNKEVQELSPSGSPLTCSQLSPNSTVCWTITTVRGQVKHLGCCTGDGNCHQPFQPTVYPVRQNSSGSSDLIFKNVTREWAGTVTCREPFSNGTEQFVNTTVDVYKNSGAINSTDVIHRGNWTVTIIVKIADMFSALGNYNAQFSCGFRRRPSYDRRQSTPNVSWVPYNETSSIRQHYAGHFIISSPFPAGSFDRYCLERDIIIFPGRRPVRLTLEEFRKIEFPSLPTASCDADYIPEVGSVNCSCTSTSLGRPQGRLRWLLGGQTIASGDEGVGLLPLPANVLNRSHDGESVACHLEWAWNLTSALKIRMAYGPDGVIIKNYMVFSSKSNGTESGAGPQVLEGKAYVPHYTSSVLLVCEAIKVNPLTSDMIQWGGVCKGQQGITCNLTSRGKEDDGKKVTCTVNNLANNGYSSSASVILKVAEGPKNISIRYHTSVLANGKCQVVLTCQVDEVRPLTSEMFEWNGMCDGQKGPTCVVTDILKEEDGKEVTCTVTNHVNRDVSVSASVRVTFSDCAALLEASPYAFKKGLGIGIGATLTLVLLGVGAVLAVLWRRGMLCEEPVYDQPEPRAQDPDHLYEMAETKIVKIDGVQEGQQQDDTSDPSPPGNVYENFQCPSKTQPASAKRRGRK